MLSAGALSGELLSLSAGALSGELPALSAGALSGELLALSVGAFSGALSAGGFSADALTTVSGLVGKAVSDAANTGCIMDTAIKSASSAALSRCRCLIFIVFLLKK